MCECVHTVLDLRKWGGAVRFKRGCSAPYFFSPSLSASNGAFGGCLCKDYSGVNRSLNVNAADALQIGSQTRYLCDTGEWLVGPASEPSSYNTCLDSARMGVQTPAQSSVYRRYVVV